MLKPISIFGYLAMVGGLVSMVATRSVFSASPLVVAPQALAVVLLVWARITFGRRSFHLAATPTAGGLVTTGPYRWIRHPIYTAVCLFVTAGAAAHWSWRTALFCALVWAGAAARMFCEETLLARQYPDYPDYAPRTARMIPGIL